MIVEMRMYHVRPGTATETANRMGKALPHREHLSPLGGLWETVTGELDTVIHMWPYESVQQRMDVRKAMINPPHWPPPLREFLLEMNSAILLPAPFSPPMKPERHGAIYEFCIDSYLPGGPTAVIDAWSKAIDARTKLSPLVFCGTTEFGRLNQVVHVWAYRDEAHRTSVERQLIEQDLWPRHVARELLLRQERLLAKPSAYSPLS